MQYAKYCYANYPTIVNNIPEEKKTYDNTPLSYATMDNGLADAQMDIGESSNLAQIALTYSYNFPEQKYQDYVCILSVIAQLAIDSSKRRFDIDIHDEIQRIKKDMKIDKHGYPAFWAVVKKDFNRNKIDYSLTCPMNALCDRKIQNARTAKDTMPISEFYQKFPLDENRRKCRKVEELIQKYSFDLYTSDYLTNESTFILMQEEFDNLIEDVRQIYISKNYLGLMSWLIDRAFNITAYQQNKISKTKLNNNRALLTKVLYKTNPRAFLSIFAKNVV